MSARHHVTTRQCDKMKNNNKNIGLFGSSFNPPHQGHFKVLESLTKKRVFDAIWLVPVFRHPFDKNLAPFKVRIEMVDLLLKDLKNKTIQISMIEKELGKEPSYTYDTIVALKKQNPGTNFSLILGTDTKNELNKWHRYKELKNLVGFYFIPRKGYEDSPFPKVSSTEIRNSLKEGKPIDGLTTKKIASYLIENKIY